jgi:hypothetical protein
MSDQLAYKQRVGGRVKFTMKPVGIRSFWRFDMEKAPRVGICESPGLGWAVLKTLRFSARALNSENSATRGIEGMMKQIEKASASK